MRSHGGQEFLNRLPPHGLKLFYEDVLELEQARRASHFPSLLPQTKSAQKEVNEDSRGKRV
jgi:hypothetical protein